MIKMNPLINRFYDMGFSIIPTGQDKRPVIQWKEYITRRATLPELNAWFVNGNNPAVICGEISNNLVIIDCDDPHVSELLQIETLTVKTPSGGKHLYVYSKTMPDKQQAYRGYALDIQANKAYALMPGAKTDKGEYIIIKDVPIKSFENIIEYLDTKLTPIHEERETDLQSFKKKVGTDIISKWVKFEVEGHNYKQGKCPFHGDNDPSFTVYDSGYNCFGCGEHGDVIDFVMKIERIDFKAAINMIADIVGFKPPELKGSSLNPEMRSKYLVTDLANSERFVFMYKEQIIFVSEWQKWLNWNGKIWEEQPDESMYQHAQKTVMQMYKTIPLISNEYDRREFAESVPKCESVAKIKGMLELSKAYLLEKSESFDKDSMCFVVDNGVINLNTLTLEPHDRARKVTKMSHIVYDPNAKCPKWEADIDKAFKGNKETIRFYQKAIGYSMTGSMKEQCFFIQWGNGANLKSTLTDVTSYIMGDYSQEMSIETIQSKDRNNQGACPELAILAGARFVRTGENNDKFKLSEGLIKQMTAGNDGKITCRKLYENDSSYMAEFKLWIATNHKPQIKGTDYAIWRRVKMIPFTYTITEAEKIPDYHKIIIAEESSGVLNWMLEGVRLWKLEGLGTCPDVEEATTKFRTENDTIQQFINECCDMRGNFTVPSQELYKAYLTFCEELGEPYLTQRDLKTKLEEKGFNHKKGRRTNEYCGLKMKSENTNSNESVEDCGGKNPKSPKEDFLREGMFFGSTNLHTKTTHIENTHNIHTIYYYEHGKKYIPT
jgi:P4 family phage/plasmid primase-like protien